MNKWKIGLLALLGITASSPALAGPAVVVGALIGGAVAAGAAAAGLIAASILTAAAIGAAVGAVAGAIAPDLLGGMFDVPDYNVAQNAQSQNDGVLVNKLGTLQHIPVVYGQRKVGGTIVFLSTQGNRNKYLYVCLVVSEGEIDSFEEIYINDVVSTDSQFNGRLSIQTFTGSDTQAYSTLLAEADGWDNNMTLHGVAYIAARFEWKKIENNDDADANPYSGVPKIQAVIRGKKVKSSGGLTNSHSTTYYNETDLGWSNNPADNLLDYLRNPRYGRGLSNDRIDFNSFSVARTKYANTVTYRDGSTGPVLTCDTVVDTGRSILDNTKIFLANSRSGLPFVQGRFKLKLQDTGHETDSQNTTPQVVSIGNGNKVTMDHIVGGVKLQGNGTREHFNQVKLTYIDPTNEWQTNEVIYPELNSSEDINYLAQDNGRRLTKEMSFNNVIYKNIAADLARIILEQSRNRKHIEFTGTAELHEAEVGDIINVDYSPLGIDTYYRINSIKLNSDYTFNITASEHLPSNYVFSDRATILGGESQKQYVGDDSRPKNPGWRPILIPLPVPPPPTPPIRIIIVPYLPIVRPGVPRLPAPTPRVTNATFRIDSAVVQRTSDSAKYPPRVYYTLKIHIDDNVADQINKVLIGGYYEDGNLVDGLFGEFDPSIKTKVSGFYEHIVGFKMDGSDNKVRLLAVMDNGDRLPSGFFTVTTPVSKYAKTTNVIF